MASATASAAWPGIVLMTMSASRRVSADASIVFSSYAMASPSPMMSGSCQFLPGWRAATVMRLFVCPFFSMTVHAATAEAAVLPLPMTAAEVALFQRSGSPRALSSWSKASTMPMTSVL